MQGKEESKRQIIKEESKKQTILPSSNKGQQKFELFK